MTAVAVWAPETGPRWPWRTAVAESPWQSVAEVSGAIATAVFEASHRPRWLDPVRNRLVDLLALEGNWDRQGSKAIRRETAHFALELLGQLMRRHTPAPHILPLAYGGIQLEWHERGIDLEVEIAAPNKVYVAFDDLLRGEETEFELSADLSPLAEPINLLTTR